MDMAAEQPILSLWETRAENVTEIESLAGVAYEKFHEIAEYFATKPPQIADNPHLKHILPYLEKMKRHKFHSYPHFGVMYDRIRQTMDDVRGLMEEGNKGLLKSTMKALYFDLMALNDSIYVVVSMPVRVGKNTTEWERQQQDVEIGTKHFEMLIQSSSDPAAIYLYRKLLDFGFKLNIVFLRGYEFEHNQQNLWISDFASFREISAPPQRETELLYVRFLSCFPDWGHYDKLGIEF